MIAAASIGTYMVLAFVLPVDLVMSELLWQIELKGSVKAKANDAAMPNASEGSATQAPTPLLLHGFIIQVKAQSGGSIRWAFSPPTKCLWQLFEIKSFDCLLAGVCIPGGTDVLKESRRIFCQANRHLPFCFILTVRVSICMSFGRS